VHAKAPFKALVSPKVLAFYSDSYDNRRLGITG
jgi:hypothetical protein